jgi:hypothetical protein
MLAINYFEQVDSLPPMSTSAGLDATNAKLPVGVATTQSEDEHQLMAQETSEHIMYVHISQPSQ